MVVQNDLERFLKRIPHFGKCRFIEWTDSWSHRKLLAHNAACFSAEPGLTLAAMASQAHAKAPIEPTQSCHHPRSIAGLIQVLGPLSATFPKCFEQESAGSYRGYPATLRAASPLQAPR
jgi:hypothetical protein